MTTNPKIPAVEIALRTDPGRDPDKQVNEDSAVHLETAHGLLCVVCDGMGGHAGGKEASELAIATITEILSAAPPQTPPGIALKRAIEEANARVWSMPTAEAGFRPGSTVVAALLHDGGAELAHVGDSRIYLVHAGAIAQVTRDHSMVQEMVDRNLIRAEDAAKHPDANKILRALGIAKDVEVELRPEPLPFVSGDVLILCSDGLSDLAEPADILAIAGSHPAAQAAGQLIDLANARGGHDNITAMVVRLKSSSAARETPPLMKTMPLTAAGAPIDAAPTVVSPPHFGQTVPGAPMQVPVAIPMPAPSDPQQHQHVSIPMAPPPPSSSRPSSRSPLVALGVVLAFLSIAIMGVGIFVFTRPNHHPARVIEPSAHEAAAPEPEDEGGEPPPLVPAPPLEPSLGAGAGAGAKPWLKDGQAPDPCGAVRRLRARGDADAGLIERLEAKCRDSGGTP